MSTQVTTQQPAVQEATRGRGRGRGRSSRKGGRSQGAVERKHRSPVEQESKESGTVDTTTTVDATTTSGEEPGDDGVCWICAEPVKYWSVADCNHRTCHVCALRLRALYKKTDCAFCKEPQRTVIFTASADAEFSSYKPDDIPFKDARLSICFETQEMMEETLILLKFNCPNDDCDYIANGWGDLKLHTRAVHGRLICDLCIRHKKVFSHEHALYPPNVLPVHLPSMHHRHVKQIPKDKVEGGVHPMCEFCNECFFGSDEHYSHMRERHEECFICKRNGVQFQYFQNYDSLERHFNTVHHPCTQPECKERKFVVFNTPLDLQAHMVEEHGAAMSTRDKKDARKIAAEFQFEGVVGLGRGRRDGQPRERDREPPPGPPPPRTLAGPSNSRRAAFGASLSDGTNPTPTIHPSPSGTSTPLATDVDPAVAERHSALITRLQSFAQNPANAVTAFKAAARGYRASEISSRDFLLTIFSVLSNDLEHTASIVNGFVDLLDEEDKKKELLSTWQGFRTEQRQQFPDLMPQRLGEGYANIASGRVLNAKHSTATRSSRPSRQVWERVAAAASSSHSFPPPRQTIQKKTGNYPPLPVASSSSASSLGTATTTTTSTKPFRQSKRTTPWSASANATASPRIIEPFSVPGSSSPSKSSKAPKLDKSLFPELPSSASSKEKPRAGGNQSLKNILGSTGPAVPAWKASSVPGSGNNSDSNIGTGVGDDVTGGEGEEGATGKKGKKGKGKQKQTLFTIGTFPS